MKKLKILRKLRKKAAFTLVELLVAIMLLAMLAVTIGACVTTALQVYRTSIFSSESEVLTSTLETAMGDMLNYAKYVGENGDGDVVFTNAAYGINSGGHFVLREGYVCYLPYEGAEEAERVMLINRGAYTNMHLTDFTLSYDTGTHLFSVVYSVVSDTSDQLYKIKSCSFRSLTEGLSR